MMKIELYEFLINEVKLRPSDVSLSTNVHQPHECLLCGNVFTVTAKSKIVNFRKYNAPGCPICTAEDRYSLDREEMLAKITHMGYSVLSPIERYKEKVLVLNTNCNCGRSWETTPQTLLSGRAFCRPCNDDKKRQRFDDLNKERAVEDDGSLESYRRIVRNLTSKTYDKHEDVINPNGHQRGRSGNGDSWHLDHIVPIVQCYRNSVPPEICADVSNLQMVFWENNAKKWSKPPSFIPDIIKPYFIGKSKLIERITEFLDSVGAEYSTSLSADSIYDLTVQDTLNIKLFMFDEVVEQNLKSKSFIKTFSGQNCFILFQNEIEDSIKFNIVKSRILNKLRSEIVTKIPARKCTVEEIESKESKAFLENNHMQGFAKADHTFVLKYDNEIVALCSFSKPRAFVNNKARDPGEYELVRYVTKVNHNVVGGMSRLLKAFEKQYSPKKVFSYSDNRWGIGNVYAAVGMSFVKDCGQNYWYLIDGQLKHRFNYAKHMIKKRFPDQFDESLTEYQNMLALGYDRIWDCGSRLFIKEY